MADYTHFSARASLAAIGVWMEHMKLWNVVEGHVHIRQKVIDHRPIDKLKDAFINILAGGHGTVEINTRLRHDEAVQQAFGRDGCADQSTVSDTLNACHQTEVEQMRQAQQVLLRASGRAYQHEYDKQCQILDVDLTGMPAGRGGEGVTKGYFSGQRGRRGRQLGRVLATVYDEVIVDRLYPGTKQLEQNLQELVLCAEDVLALEETKRAQTLIRVDGGGGRDADINWLLARGYDVIIKVKNWQRAKKLAQSVQAWYPDPKVPSREIGWVEQPHAYRRPTRQVAIRKQMPDGKWRYRVLVCSLSDELLFRLLHRAHPQSRQSRRTLYAVMRLYDLRGGGVETSIRGSKQGLGLTKRNKRRFCAQEMLVLLAQLAYNLLTWMQASLSHLEPRFRKFGKLRIIRDLFHIPGQVLVDAQGRVLNISLDGKHVLAASFARGIRRLLSANDMWPNWDEN
jgi:hypothetical protein